MRRTYSKPCRQCFAARLRDSHDWWLALMRVLHYQQLKPVCPCCKIKSKISYLDLVIFSGNEEDILSGKLFCPDEECKNIYPIVYGVPILVPDVSGWLTANLHLIGLKPFTDPELDVLIGKLIHPESAFTITRQQQSSYCLDHYENEIKIKSSRVKDNSLKSSTNSFLDFIFKHMPSNRMPILDLGCAVGGATFRIAAQTRKPTLGVDQNWSFIQIAKNLLACGISPYSHRVIANEFEIREIELECNARELVDFWVADALSLPFDDDRFGAVVASNLIDCVTDPGLLIENLAKVSCDSSRIFLTTPYDWATHATPPMNWIYDTKDFSSFLERVNGYLKSRHDINLSHFTDPKDFLWTLHLHDRAVITYATEINILSVGKRCHDRRRTENES